MCNMCASLHLDFMVFGTSRLMVFSGSASYNWNTRSVSVGDGFRLVDESDIPQFW